MVVLCIWKPLKLSIRSTINLVLVQYSRDVYCRKQLVRVAYLFLICNEKHSSEAALSEGFLQTTLNHFNRKLQ